MTAITNTTREIQSITMDDERFSFSNLRAVYSHSTTLRTPLRPRSRACLTVSFNAWIGLRRTFCMRFVAVVVSCESSAAKLVTKPRRPLNLSAPAPLLPVARAVVPAFRQIVTVSSASLKPQTLTRLSHCWEKIIWDEIGMVWRFKGRLTNW